MNIHPQDPLVQALGGPEKYNEIMNPKKVAARMAKDDLEKKQYQQVINLCNQIYTSDKSGQPTPFVLTMFGTSWDASGYGSTELYLALTIAQLHLLPPLHYEQDGKYTAVVGCTSFAADAAENIADLCTLESGVITALVERYKEEVEAQSESFKSSPDWDHSEDIFARDTYYSFLFSTIQYTLLKNDNAKKIKSREPGYEALLESTLSQVADGYLLRDVAFETGVKIYTRAKQNLESGGKYMTASSAQNSIDSLTEEFYHAIQLLSCSSCSNADFLGLERAEVERRIVPDRLKILAECINYDLQATIYIDDQEWSLNTNRSELLARLKKVYGWISEYDHDFVIPEFPDETAIMPPVEAYSETSTPPAGNSGGCYVATAVYGSYDCPEVWTLRRYRDYTLAAT